MNAGQNHHREPFGRTTQRQPQRDPNAMDVNAITINEGPDRANWREWDSLSDAEQEKKLSEGQCFLCRRRSHIQRSQLEQDKGGWNGKGNRRGKQVCAVTTGVSQGGSQQGGEGRENNDALTPIAPGFGFATTQLSTHYFPPVGGF
jgi:hypothetical protein